MPYLIVFLGVGIGGAARHAVNTPAARTMGYGFLWGTLTVNVLCSIVMGLLTEFFVVRYGLAARGASVHDNRASGRSHDLLYLFARHRQPLGARTMGAAGRLCHDLADGFDSRPLPRAFSYPPYWPRELIMKTLVISWRFWALLSAGFAALTAIFAKVGVENVNSDFATFSRTIVILMAAGLILYIRGNWQEPSSVSPRSWLFLILLGPATGVPGFTISGR